MSSPWLLLPDFALIALGWALCRWTSFDRKVWDGVERLVYYLLFPALLFAAIIARPISIESIARFGALGLSVVAAGVLLASVLARLPGVDARLHASGAQVAFRFNSYVALALAERLGGAAGLALMALLVSVCVPLCNVAAVWPLARQGGHGFARELLRNPLIVSTASGLAFNLLGLRLPEFASVTLQRIGGAALPLGLMAVGAGLKLGAMREAPRLAAALLAIRHVALPLLAIAIGVGLRLPPLEAAVLVVFAAVPTASSAYVLAVRLGGHGGFVAGLVSVSTLLAMPGLPLALLGLASMR